MVEGERKTRRLWSTLARSAPYAVGTAELAATIEPSGDGCADLLLDARYQCRPRGPLGALCWRTVGDRPEVDVEAGASVEVAELAPGVWQVRFDPAIESQFRLRVTSRHVRALDRTGRDPRPGLPTELAPPVEFLACACAVPVERIEIEVTAPDGWPVADPGVACWVGDWPGYAIDPTERCASTAVDHAGRSVRLAVEWPIPGHTFALAWRPGG